MTKALVSQYRSRTTMSWPCQLHPDLSTIPIWLTGIKLILRFRDDGSLCVPLGPWICDPKRYLNHDSYLHHSFQSVIVRGNSDFWKVYHLSDTTLNHYHYTLVDMISVFNFPLHHYSPCDYSVETSYITVWRRSIFNTSFPSSSGLVDPVCDSLSSCFQNSTSWYSPFLRHLPSRIIVPSIILLFLLMGVFAMTDQVLALWLLIITRLFLPIIFGFDPLIMP
jgi:hypothetical protein